MAAVDSLLRLLPLRNAELLLIASGQVPILRKSGENMSLSMPALAADLVATMVGEVVDDAARTRLDRDGGVEVTYAVSGSGYALRVEKLGDGFRLTCRPGAAAPAPAPAPPPAPVAKQIPTTLSYLLDRVLDASASDLLLSADQTPRMRVGGDLVPITAPASSSAQIEALLAPLLDAARRRHLDDTGSADGALEHNGARFRVNVFRQHAGLAAAIRPIRSRVPTLAELHLPEDLHDLARLTSGLVLVTGRAGSGKSTTLAAMIEEQNRTRARHVITLEDPIEYVYTPNRCLIHQREVGVQVESFAGGLRAALRESPDIILVGEMRDRDTIAAALTAAETGHLVLSTLHCSGAVGAIDRIVDIFPAEQQEQVRWQLALTLRAVFSQVLVAGTGGARFPGYEKMMMTPAVAAQIRDGKLHKLASIIQTGRDSGMAPMERTLAALVQSGKVTRAAARDAAFDPAALDELMR